jgi:hypothetical protein
MICGPLPGAAITGPAITLKTNAVTAIFCAPENDDISHDGWLHKKDMLS